MARGSSSSRARDGFDVTVFGSPHPPRADIADERADREPGILFKRVASNDRYLLSKHENQQGWQAIA